MTSNPSPESPNPRLRWRPAQWDEPDTLYFWSGRGGQFERFSNFALTPFWMARWQNPTRDGPVCIRRERVSSREGLHGQSSTGGFGSRQRRLRPTAWRKAQLPADWDRRRGQVVLAVLRAKFAVPELGELLLSTGERLLAEDSAYDPVWGCRDRAGGYRGQNLLGRALMRVRDELRDHDSVSVRAQTWSGAFGISRAASRPRRHPAQAGQAASVAAIRATAVRSS